MSTIERGIGATGSWFDERLRGAGFLKRTLNKVYPDAIRTLAAETGRRLPYLGSPAYKKVFGRSLGELWKDFAAKVGEQGSRATNLRLELTGPWPPYDFVQMQFGG